MKENEVNCAFYNKGACEIAKFAWTEICKGKDAKSGETDTDFKEIFNVVGSKLPLLACLSSHKGKHIFLCQSGLYKLSNGVDCQYPTKFPREIIKIYG